VIIALVVAHELGHFLAAKACGMRVDEFAVGFGNPKWVVTKRHGTEYTIRPIPAGGFVRIPGMDPSEEGPADGFNAQSVWKRMIVIFAGPFASFVFAYLTFIVLGVTAGLPNPDAPPTLQQLNKSMPAYQYGLRDGDTLLQVQDLKVKGSDDVKAMIETIMKRPGQPVKVVVKRGDRTQTFNPVAKAVKVDGKMIGRLGFVPGDGEWTKYSLMGSISRGTEESVSMVVKLVTTVFSKRIAKEAGGPIAILSTANSAAQAGLKYLILLTALLSLNFAVMNLLPIPVLDGGLLMLLTVEAVRGRRLSTKTQQAALTFGLAVIGVIIVLVMAKDISGLLHLGK